MNSEVRGGVGVQAAAVFGGMLVLGLILGGWVLGSEIKDMKLADRYVTVRGLTERTVKANVATWDLDFKESGDVLPSVFVKSGQSKAATLTFLAAQGITAQEIEVGSVTVDDRQTEQYGEAEKKGPRYIVSQTISVQSKNVDGIAAAQQRSSSLIEGGVILVSGSGKSGVQYIFTGLNAIKPDMITEATKNARAAADRFAADSGSKVGTIRRAEQGVFTITDANAASASGEEGGGGGQASVMKKIRVVTTVDYYLER